MNKNQVINVLDQPHYGDCHIAGTASIPYDQLKNYVVQFSKDTELVLYCVKPGCYIAHQAVLLLKALGYTNLYLYQGGIIEWQKKGFQTRGHCLLDGIHDDHKKRQERINGVTQLTAEELNDKISKLT